MIEKCQRCGWIINQCVCASLPQDDDLEPVLEIFSGTREMLERLTNLDVQEQAENDANVLRSQVNIWERTAIEHKAKIERLEAVLDKLAILGNEPHYGNSSGNSIAQAALKDAEIKRLSDILNTKCSHVWTNEFGLKPFYCIYCGEKPPVSAQSGQKDQHLSTSEGESVQSGQCQHKFVHDDRSYQYGHCMYCGKSE